MQQSGFAALRGTCMLHVFTNVESLNVSESDVGA